jgi:sugar/nucleoside kinase (ribokinase family)
VKTNSIRHKTVIVGPATLDTVVTGDGIVRKIGGVPTYGGLTFRQHDISVTALTNIADCDLVHFSAYQKAGIQLVTGQTQVTTHFVNRESLAGRTQELPAVAAPISHGAEILAESGAVHLHLGPLFPEDISPDLLQTIQGLPSFKSLDLQGYVRKVREGKVEPGVPQIDVLSLALSVADIIKGDELEIQTVTNVLRLGILELLERFDIRHALITDGRNGGRLIGRDGMEIPYTPLPLVDTKDTTGAGDVFFAAFLCRWFHEDWPEREALDHAARTAAAHVKGLYLPVQSLLF